MKCIEPYVTKLSGSVIIVKGTRICKYVDVLQVNTCVVNQPKNNTYYYICKIYIFVKFRRNETG